MKTGSPSRGLQVYETVSFNLWEISGPAHRGRQARLFDQLAKQDDNRDVVHSVRRAIISLILVPYVALAAAVAPEHVHEADADHPHSTVHRHLEPHHPGSHDHGHAELADDDGHVVWLDSVAVQWATFHFWTPQHIRQAIFGLLPLRREWAAILNYDTPPAHGPPRASPSLRGPPHLSA